MSLLLLHLMVLLLVTLKLLLILEVISLMPWLVAAFLEVFPPIRSLLLQENQGLERLSFAFLSFAISLILILALASFILKPSLLSVSR